MRPEISINDGEYTGPTIKTVSVNFPGVMADDLVKRLFAYDKVEGFSLYDGEPEEGYAVIDPGNGYLMGMEWDRDGVLFRMDQPCSPEPGEELDGTKLWEWTTLQLDDILQIAANVKKLAKLLGVTIH